MSLPTYIGFQFTYPEDHVHYEYPNAHPRWNEMTAEERMEYMDAWMEHDKEQRYVAQLLKPHVWIVQFKWERCIHFVGKTLTDCIRFCRDQDWVEEDTNTIYGHITISIHNIQEWE